MEVGLLVAMGDEGGEGVILEKSSNLCGELRRWDELPGSAGVSNDSTPKLNRMKMFTCMSLDGFYSNTYLGASGVTVGGKGLPVT